MLILDAEAPTASSPKPRTHGLLARPGTGWPTFRAASSTHAIVSSDGRTDSATCGGKEVATDNLYIGGASELVKMRRIAAISVRT
jgi:hypothetical protein